MFALLCTRAAFNPSGHQCLFSILPCAENASYHPIVTMDAVLKCGRFANVGNAAQLQPHSDQFFGTIEKDVQQAAEQNR